MHSLCGERRTLWRKMHFTEKNPLYRERRKLSRLGGLQRPMHSGDNFLMYAKVTDFDKSLNFLFLYKICISKSIVIKSTYMLCSNQLFYKEEGKTTEQLFRSRKKIARSKICSRICQLISPDLLYNYIFENHRRHFLDLYSS